MHSSYSTVSISHALPLFQICYLQWEKKEGNRLKTEEEKEKEKEEKKEENKEEREEGERGRGREEKREAD